MEDVDVFWPMIAVITTASLSFVAVILWIGQPREGTRRLLSQRNCQENCRVREHRQLRSSTCEKPTASHYSVYGEGSDLVD
jgi:hypothetical protein